MWCGWKRARFKEKPWQGRGLKDWEKKDRTRREQGAGVRMLEVKLWKRGQLRTGCG